MQISESSVKYRDYFCIDGLLYHGVIISVLWDREGSRYGRGAGLHVLVNGKAAASSRTIRKLKIDLEAFIK